MCSGAVASRAVAPVPACGDSSSRWYLQHWHERVPPVPALLPGVSSASNGRRRRSGGSSTSTRTVLFCLSRTTRSNRHLCLLWCCTRSRAYAGSQANTRCGVTGKGKLPLRRICHPLRIDLTQNNHVGRSQATTGHEQCSITCIKSPTLALPVEQRTCMLADARRSMQAWRHVPRRHATSSATAPVAGVPAAAAVASILPALPEAARAATVLDPS